ncbi:MULTISPECIES: flagellar protein FlaG [Pseudobutyrivibrio]|uniref:Flagellar protein FlaG n=1 Tax=Pseudobutyrivibrio xylanivorans TaxID=185007 RepID=A0A1G5RXA0_PSEXY|nr:MULTISPECIES: flagellar protein FlaG [Pseudobutyrivibrio]MDC7278899.1 flagellar protein FlaG [Butyrivibrio fibrisolvens]SCZ78765.1 flagellar protein FlaG [Pseudobutyrivibrio xylanivorans]
MKIGEVSSAVSNYQGQGSSGKTAPVQATQSTPVDFATAAKEIRASEPEYKNPNSNPEQEEAEDKAMQASSSLKEAISKINSAQGNAEAVFGIHEGTNRVTIKMVDKQTKKVIKEFPAEETLDLIAKAWELAGIMVDEKR